MSIRSRAELNHLLAIGRIVRTVLDEMAAAVRPGVTTAELDHAGAAVLRQHGAESSPVKFYGFPTATCISVNDEAIHGIPGSRVLEEGDLVKLDVTADKNGFVADAAITVTVGKASPTAEALARCAVAAFREGLKSARAGNRVYEIGRAVDREVRRRGFRVIRELCGHGVGRAIHESPSVPNYYDRRSRTKLTDGLVITIEPIIAASDAKAELQDDNWTIRTSDGSLAAHYEHTIVVTTGEPILVTAA